MRQINGVVRPPVAEIVGKEIRQNGHGGIRACIALRRERFSEADSVPAVIQTASALGSGAPERPATGADRRCHAPDQRRTTPTSISDD
jgi:hypothetical protein